MKEEKLVNQLKFRVTDAEKEKILAYCEENNLTVSGFLRKATANLLQKER